MFPSQSRNHAPYSPAALARILALDRGDAVLGAERAFVIVLERHPAPPQCGDGGAKIGDLEAHLGERAVRRAGRGEQGEFAAADDIAQTARPLLRRLQAQLLRIPGPRPLQILRRQPRRHFRRLQHSRLLRPPCLTPAHARRPDPGSSSRSRCDDNEKSAPALHRLLFRSRGDAGTQSPRGRAANPFQCGLPALPAVPAGSLRPEQPRTLRVSAPPREPLPFQCWNSSASLGAGRGVAAGPGSFASSISCESLQKRPRTHFRTGCGFGPSG